MLRYKYRMYLEPDTPREKQEEKERKELEKRKEKEQEEFERGRKREEKKRKEKEKEEQRKQEIYDLYNSSEQQSRRAHYNACVANGASPDYMPDSNGIMR